MPVVANPKSGSLSTIPLGLTGTLRREENHSTLRKSTYYPDHHHKTNEKNFTNLLSYTCIFGNFQDRSLIRQLVY